MKYKEKVHKNSALFTAQKMKFSIKNFFSKCVVTFTEEILNGKLYFLCSDCAEMDNRSSVDGPFNVVIDR